MPTSRKSKSKTKSKQSKRVISQNRIRPERALRFHLPDLQLFLKTKLTVAVYADFYPVAYFRQETQTFEGLDVDILRGFSEMMGLKPPKFVRTDSFKRIWKIPGEWNPRVDIAIGGIGRTGSRDDPTIEWTLPYFRVQRTIVYNLQDPIRNFPDDVHGKLIGTAGSTGMTDAKRLLVRAGKRHLLFESSGNDAADIQQLLDGKVQGLMRGSFVGHAIVKKYPDRLGMMPPWKSDAGSWGKAGEIFALPCRRGSGLAALLNAYLLQLSASGGLADLVEKHNMKEDL